MLYIYNINDIFIYIIDYRSKLINIIYIYININIIFANKVKKIKVSIHY